MIDRRIEDISVSDLTRLRDNSVAEGRTLEYKEELPRGNDADKKEFLADVSSFANALGGDLLYGMKAARDDQGKSTGVVESVSGVAVENRDVVLQRLENILRDGAAPRIAGIRFRWIDGFPNGPVLLIRVPRSWAGPHMVRFQESSRFFSRNSNGKYQLDVFELRAAFLESGSLSERARELRAERLGHVLADDAPVELNSQKIICVHGIPHSALAGGVDVDIRQPLEVTGGHELIYPYGASGFRSTSFNIDGLLSYDRSGNAEKATQYLQLFRTGTVESVDAGHIENESRHYSNSIGGLGFAQRTLPFVSRLRRLWRLLEIDPPMSIFVSLIGAKGVRLYVNNSDSGTFDRDQLFLPELLLTNHSGDVAELCKPMLDVLWQAAGFRECNLYRDGKLIDPSWVR